MRKLMVIGWLSIALFGCSSEPRNTPSGHSAAGTARPVAVDTYAQDMEDVAVLVGEYVRYRERNKEWPKPGTYQSKNLIYKGSEPGSIAFPDRRRDFYYTLHRGGRELDVKLWPDGRYEVAIIAEH